MTDAALIASGLAVAGAWAGFSRPLAAIGLGVGLVAVWPTLPWHLGAGNLAYSLAYLVGLETGWFAARLRDSRRLAGRAGDFPGAELRFPPRSANWLLVAGVALAVAAIVGWARNYGLGAEVRWADGLAVNPSGLAGRLHASLVMAAGLMLLPIAHRVLAAPGAWRAYERAFLAGTGLALLAPLLQTLFGDPTVRPDRGLDSSVGLVGFFQDPHSHAAYLIVALGVSLGAASSAPRHSPARLAGGIWSSALLGLLLFTNSRSGLLSAFAVMAIFVLLRWTLGASPARLHRVALVILVVLGLGAVASIPGVRGSAYESLSRLGNQRMWEVLNPAGTGDPLMARRFLLWRKGLMLVESNPLWGVGPGGYRQSEVDFPERVTQAFAAARGEVELQRALDETAEENAHNYYVQYSAEIGILGIVGLIGLIASILAFALGQVRRAHPSVAGRTIGVVSGLTGFLVISMLSHPLLLAEMQLLFWSSAAYLSALAMHCDRPDDLPWGPGSRAENTVAT